MSSRWADLFDMSTKGLPGFDAILGDTWKGRVVRSPCFSIIISGRTEGSCHCGLVEGPRRVLPYLHTISTETCWELSNLSTWLKGLAIFQTTAWKFLWNYSDLGFKLLLWAHGTAKIGALPGEPSVRRLQCTLSHTSDCKKPVGSCCFLFKLQCGIKCGTIVKEKHFLSLNNPSPFSKLATAEVRRRISANTKTCAAILR